MHRTRTSASALAVGIVVAALALAGCALATAEESTEPSASTAPSQDADPTPTGSDDSEAAPVQTPAEPPASAEDAVSGASHMIDEYLPAYLVFNEEHQDPEYLASFVATDSVQWQTLETTVEANMENDAWISGGPFVWDADAATSEVTDGTVPFGEVALSGCLDNSNVDFYLHGEIDASFQRGRLPVIYNVTYDPGSQAWLLTDFSYPSPGETPRAEC